MLYMVLFMDVLLFDWKIRFEEKIKEIKNIILNKRDKITKNILNSYGTILKDISDGCQQILQKIDAYHDENVPKIKEISYDYESVR